MTYIALPTEPSTWTVGYHAPDGQWEPDEDYPTLAQAERRARELNGVDCPLFDLEGATA